MVSETFGSNENGPTKAVLPAMTNQHGLARRIQRSFCDLSDEIANAVEQASFLVQLGWTGAISWSELLQSSRVLIVSESGSGKTYECRAEQEARWNSGEPAFFFELADLCHFNLSDLLNAEEQRRFEAWRVSQSDVAVIFLDSIDELKLTQGSFETALKRLSRALDGQLARVRIVITTRPIPIDREIIRRHLPIPESSDETRSEAAFADLAISGHRKNKKASNDVFEWRNVALLPLSDDQMLELMAFQGVTDAEAMLDDIRQRNAEEFARRPQDLIELSVDWRDHRRIRTHREQIANSIALKLKPRTDRKEKTPLTEEQAFEGASRLAIAALLTRKLTLRHSAQADEGGETGAALEPATILSDWTADQRATLLERALFGFAGYGRVRFHHRSVMEYLAAQSLDALLNRGMKMSAVKRLLFTETPFAVRVVKPSMRPVAAWLAKSQISIFGEIRDCEPEILLNYADPESLTSDLQMDALGAYVHKYGHGGDRGLRVPSLQIHRIASGDIGREVLRLWAAGVQNPEVRELLLELVAAVPIQAGADIAFSVAMRKSADLLERIRGLEALVKLNDARLDEITRLMLAEPEAWPDELLMNLVPLLTPALISADLLCQLVSRFSSASRGLDLFGHSWATSIAKFVFPSDYLTALREGLTKLVAGGVNWRADRHQYTTSTEYLLAPLAAICHRQLNEADFTAAVIESSVLVLRLANDDHSRLVCEPADALRTGLWNLPPCVRASAFWADDAFRDKRRPGTSPRRRFFEGKHDGPIRLNFEQDGGWVLGGLCDSSRALAERSILLEAALLDVWNGQGDWREYLLNLKELVSDHPELTATIDERLAPPVVDPDVARMEAQHLIRAEKEKRTEAENHESWAKFWREVADHPDTAFGPKRAENTAWNLWDAMSRSGEASRSSGWNRRLIERSFNKDVADRLRVTMMKIWRKDHPSLRSERLDNEKGTTLVGWQFGLAAIAAEAEAPQWAHILSFDDAKLAARYVPLELNGFPSWLESLATAMPKAVEIVLGPELTSELETFATPNSHRIFLQNVGYAATVVAELFLPRLQAWIHSTQQHVSAGEDGAMAAERLRHVLNILLKYGSGDTRARFREIAKQQLVPGLDSPLAFVWLSAYMDLDPMGGVDCLEQGLRNFQPATQNLGAQWIGSLFGDRNREPLVGLSNPGFTPALLLKLVRLAYREVAPTDDINHDGPYSPGLRDHAERGRERLLYALLESKGKEGWKAKLEMADDPMFQFFKDRALAIAKQKAAEEADVTVHTETQVAALYRHSEVSPVTREGMFALLKDRLDDIDDLLRSDVSPSEAWALITDERIMRKEIAREMRNASNHAYTVDQESVTADEKETDIRLRAADSVQQAVIELKLGARWSGRDLRDAIKDQLVTKYMAPDECRCGCLLVTVAKNRTWEHPARNSCWQIAADHADIPPNSCWLPIVG